MKTHIPNTLHQPLCGATNLVHLALDEELCRKCLHLHLKAGTRVEDEVGRLVTLLRLNHNTMGIPIQINGIIELLTWVRDGCRGPSPTEKWFKNVPL